MPRTPFNEAGRSTSAFRAATLSWFGQQRVKLGVRTDGTVSQTIWRRRQWGPLLAVLALIHGSAQGVAQSAVAQADAAKTQADVARTEVPKTRGAPVAAGTSEIPKAPIGAPVTTAVAPQEAVATAVRVHVNGSRTIFELATTRPVVSQVFVLSNPDRVVVDLSDLEFDLPASAGKSGNGVVLSFRYGLVAAGRSRIVIDVTRPVRVVRAGMATAPHGQPPRLEVELEAAPGAWAPTTLPASTNVPQQPKAFAERKPGGRFIVMIDPGHGGIDGGAISGLHIVEKDVTLAVARQLKSVLEARQRYDVRLTRLADTFVSLDARVELSQAAGADLFISIHADSVGDAAIARTARGAAVYTLSETASNQAAQQFADKENAADTAGGLGNAADNAANQVNSILADLVKRETHNFSLQFKSLLLDRLRPVNILGRDPSRAAAFKVLRQMQTPTVLIELGFLTHEMDAQQMQSADWQKRIAAAIAMAVDSYAAKRSEVAR